MFDTITERTLPSRINETTMRWCPTVDLIAFVNQDGDSVWVYRLNGQRVWTFNSPKTIAQVEWRFDGNQLSVIHDDGGYQILNASSGKPVRAGEGEIDASLVTWTVRDPQPSSQVNQGISSLGLPHDIFDLDISKHMPKLPLIPTSTKPSVSSLNLEDATPELELLIAGTKTGGLSLSIYGVFDIGVIPGDISGQVNGITANSDLSEHMTLVKTASETQLVTWNIDFIRKFGLTYLPEVSITPARIIALVSYIQESVSVIEAETKELLEQTTKAMVGLGSDKTQIQCDLFDTLITGVVKPSVVMWLKRHLMERGLKKWHKACIYGYETASKVLFENLIPAVERLLVLLTKLQGLAKWTDRGAALGLSAAYFKSVIESTTTFMKQATKCVQEIHKEFELFKSFSSWLEVVFEELPNSSLTNKMHENPESVKTTDVGVFITKCLNQSVLKKYLSPSPSSLRNNIDHVAKFCELVFTETKQSIKKLVQVQQVVNLGDKDLQVRQRFCKQDNYLYLMMASLGDTKLRLLRYQQQQEQHSEVVVEIAMVDVEDKILQVEFIDDESFMMLAQCREDDSKYRILSGTYANRLYRFASPNELQKELAQCVPEVLTIDLIRELDQEPVQFSVNGARSVAMLLYKDKQHYEFVSLDTDDDEDEDEIME